MQDVWIFGYGSLVWRPAFAHAERVPARLAGWARRFWQGSTDHRGLPGAPGRVVTVVRSDAADPCWGMAYRVGPADIARVLAGLDHREQGGYEREQVEVELVRGRGVVPDAGHGAARTGTRVRALMYLATHENPNFLGPASSDAIARQVVGAVGPSGPNPEYVTRLAESLRELGARDEHVFEIEARVLELLADRAGEAPGGS
jgi:cation transport regulator ChaC